MSIAHLNDEQLSLFGYDLVKKNDEFTLYNHVPTGYEQIVANKEPYLYVDDINDAVAMKAQVLFSISADDGDD